MSPGATFERVYLALKQTVLSGGFPPGAQLEPAALAQTLVSSITPVRDALHRLVGERLVHTPRNDGFRMPIYTEASLRDLYGWNLRLLQLAIHSRAGSGMGGAVTEPLDGEHDAVAEIAAIFVQIARLGGSAELLAAVSSSNDRLSLVRHQERSILPVREELGAFHDVLSSLDPAPLRQLIADYHRRRIAVVPRLVEHLQPTL